MKNILVPTDFSEAAASALGHAATLASATGGRIILMHVLFIEKIKEDLLGLDALEHLTRVMDLPPDEARYTPSTAVASLHTAAQRQLDAAVAAVSTTSKIETLIAEGRPSTEIVAHADKHDVDLIVMGTHGRSGLGRAFLGSVADNVIRQAECPVMVVRK